MKDAHLESRSLTTRRRDLLKLGGVLGGTMVANLGGQSSSPKLLAAESSPAKGVIDAHLHPSNALLPGIPEERVLASDTELGPFEESKRAERTTLLVKALQEEMVAADVSAALCMPLGDAVSDEDPLAIREVERLIPLVRGFRLYPIGFADPKKVGDSKHLARVEEFLRAGRVKAFKVFLGYLYFYPDHYTPYYRLAAKYDLPVIFHTGDTYSPLGKIKYSDPMWVDEVAVDNPDTKFVLAHFGNPWYMTAAELLYKNKNVWADVSGLWIGDAKYFEENYLNGVLDCEVARLRQGVEYTECDRFLFGSDWPLVTLVTYRDFVRRMFPKEQHQAVFHDNAKALFKV